MTPFLLILLPVKLFLAQTDQSASSSGSPVGVIFGLLVAVVMIVALWKIFTKAGQRGWACPDPDLQHLYFMQDRGPTGLVGDFDAHPVRKLHHRDHSFHRSGEEFRQRRWLWSGPRLSWNHLFPDPGLWQFAIPGPCRRTELTTPLTPSNSACVSR
jgi:hypothetical protein